MVGAMKEVEKGKFSINRIAQMYGVPCSTLRDRVSGRVKHGYPFNRTAIEVLDVDSGNKHRSNNSSNGDTVSKSANTTDKQTQQSEDLLSFAESEEDLGSLSKILTEQMKLKFEKRYEEGYDLPDPLYQKWLQITYPEFRNDCTTNLFTDLLQMYEF